MSNVRITGTDYRVVIQFRDGRQEQAHNPGDLSAMWRVIDGHRGKPNVKRIRVYALLETFDFE